MSSFCEDKLFAGPCRILSTGCYLQRLNFKSRTISWCKINICQDLQDWSTAEGRRASAMNVEKKTQNVLCRASTAWESVSCELGR